MTFRRSHDRVRWARSLFLPNCWIAPLKSLSDPLQNVALLHQDKHDLAQNDERHAGKQPGNVEKYDGNGLFEQRFPCELPPRDVNNERQ